MFEITPSPGTENKDFSEIEKKILAIKSFARTIHIDVIDGKFADNTTFSDPAPFAKYSKDVLLEVHLMVEDPIKYLKPFAASGFQRFIGQIEKMKDQAEFVAEAQLLGGVGLAIDKQTPVEAIKVSYEDLDTVLVMTIQAGFSGQKFEEGLLGKVRQLAQLTTIPIEVDGGINDKTIKLAKAAGASRFVATSFLFGTDKSPAEQVRLLENMFQS